MKRSALSSLGSIVTAVALMAGPLVPTPAVAAPAEDAAASSEPDDSAQPEATSESTAGDDEPAAADDGPDSTDDSPASEGDQAPPAPSEDSTASAEPADANQQEALALLREGSMFYELGQYEDAIVKFEAAWKLAPVPQLLFNLGQAHRRWYEVDPDIDHLRQAKTFFVNYDKRMQSDASYSAREVDYVENMIEKLEAQIELEEAKEAERNRVIVNGPTAAELEALEKRRIRREKQLESAHRMNGAGIGLIVVGSVAAAIGVGGVLARTAYRVVLDNSSADDPDAPTLATADEDRRRRDGFLLSGQLGFGGLIAAAVFLPIGIGLRVGGGILEKRALAGAAPDTTRGDDGPPAAQPPPKVAIQPTSNGIAIRF